MELEKSELRAIVNLTEEEMKKYHLKFGKMEKQVDKFKTLYKVYKGKSEQLYHELKGMINKRLLM